MGFQLYGILEKAKLWRQLGNVWFPGVGVEAWMDRWKREDLGGGGNTIGDTAVVNTCHYSFIQTHRINDKSEP